MRAIVDINGKQYEVEEGRYVTIDRYPADENAEVVLDNVRLIVAGGHSLIGSPFVDGATVKTRVKRHGRGPKVLVYKMRCKKGYRRKNGHRQDFTELMVDLLDFPGKDAIPAEFKAAPAPAKTAPKKAPKAATVEAPAETEKQAKAKKEAAAPAAKPKAKKAAAETEAETAEVKAPKKKSTKKEETAEAVETVSAGNVQAAPLPEAAEAPKAEAPAEAPEAAETAEAPKAEDAGEAPKTDAE